MKSNNGSSSFLRCLTNTLCIINIIACILFMIYTNAGRDYKDPLHNKYLHCNYPEIAQQEVEEDEEIDNQLSGTHQIQDQSVPMSGNIIQDENK